jgi:hypothetical protein
VHCNISKDNITGFEDLSGKRTRNIVSNALEFMLWSNATNWKLQFAFFFTTSSCAAATLKNLLFQCLKKAKNTGLTVTSVISD